MILLALLIQAAPVNRTKSDPCARSDTVGMAECIDGKIQQANAQLNHYRAVAFNRFHDEDESHDSATAKAIENAATIGDAFRTIYCDAVYQRWIAGSIRYAMQQGCTLRLINSQTYDVWRDFLNYADSTPPLLPEPKAIN